MLLARSLPASSPTRGLAATLDVLLLGTCVATCAHVRDLPLSAAPQETQDRPRVTRAFVDLLISRALIYIGFYTLLGYLLFYVNWVLAPATLASERMQTGIIIVVSPLSVRRVRRWRHARAIASTNGSWRPRGPRRSLARWRSSFRRRGLPASARPPSSPALAGALFSLPIGRLPAVCSRRGRWPPRWVSESRDRRPANRRSGAYDRRTRGP